MSCDSENVPSQPRGVDADLDRIREFGRKISAFPSELELQHASLLSHAEDHRTIDALRSYAGQVVGTRLLQFLGTTLLKTQFFIDIYLRGYDGRNPFALIMATRAQLETYAVLWDVCNVVNANAGDHDDHYAERVKRIDEFLIKALYGTRSEALKTFIEKVSGGSKLRSFRESDRPTYQALNVQTRIERASKGGDWIDLKPVYDRLCEYLHPNVGQNLLLLVPSDWSPSFVKLSRDSPAPLALALEMSAEFMAEACRRTMELADSVRPPFRMKVFTLGERVAEKLMAMAQDLYRETAKRFTSRDDVFPCFLITLDGSGIERVFDFERDFFSSEDNRRRLFIDKIPEVLAATAATAYAFGVMAQVGSAPPDEMRSGLIVEAGDPHAAIASMAPVVENDSGWRSCGEFQDLNAADLDNAADPAAFGHQQLWRETMLTTLRRAVR